MTWSIDLIPGMYPKHWRLLREGAPDGERVMLLTADDGQAMHVLEALNAYERAPLHATADCEAVHTDMATTAPGARGEG